jgi:hypothetical protein
MSETERKQEAPQNTLPCQAMSGGMGFIKRRHMKMTLRIKGRGIPC